MPANSAQPRGTLLSRGISTAAYESAGTMLELFGPSGEAEIGQILAGGHGGHFRKDSRLRPRGDRIDRAARLDLCNHN